MKLMLHAVLALALLGAIGEAGASEDEAAQLEARKAGFRKANVTVEVRCLSLPQALAIPLIHRLRAARPEEKAAALTGLDDFLTGGQARLLAWPMVTFQEGVQAGTWATEDVPHGSFYEAGSVAVCLTDQLREPRREPAVINAPSVADIGFRRAGAGLDVEAKIIRGGQSLDLTVSVQLIGLLAMDRIVVEHERTTEKRLDRMAVEQPRFSSIEHRCVLTLESGEQRLVHVSADPNAEGRLILFILCATIEPKP